MLKLTYNRKRDEFATVTVLGDAYGIRDLYWQLTYNYRPVDGTAIGSIKVSSLDGLDCTNVIMSRPELADTKLSIFP